MDNLADFTYMVIAMVVVIGLIVGFQLRMKRRLANNVGKTEKQQELDSAKLQFVKGEISKKEYNELTKSERKKVNVRLRMLLCWCPLAYIGINKFGNGFGLAIVLGIVADVFCSWLLNLVPQGDNISLMAIRIAILFSSVAIYVIPMAYFMKKWCIVWNKEIGSLQSQV